MTSMASVATAFDELDLLWRVPCTGYLGHPFRKIGEMCQGTLRRNDPLIDLDPLPRSQEIWKECSHFS
jgi:hypothetical protein